jgi:hypothetical protein
MLVLVVASLAAAHVAFQTPKPPHTEYDKKRKVTIWSTGDVRTAEYAGYRGFFEFPGKAFSAPASIDIGFGALRQTHGVGPEKYKSVLHWNDVKSIVMTFSGMSKDFPATHDFNVSKNELASVFLGDALEESLAISLTPSQFKEIAAADLVRVQLGKDTQVLKGKSLAPLKKLAACIPPS